MTTSDNEAVGTALNRVTKELAAADIVTARLDAHILLEDILGKDRAHLLAHPEVVLTATQQKELDHLVLQRKKHIPLAYLRGKVMFYGRTFYVNQDVLIPRPETEDIITLLKKYCEDNGNSKIADIGTGSGCIGLTAALELSGSTIDLYDIDAKALLVAKSNAHKLGISKVRYFQEDLLSRAGNRGYDIVVANLPYVPNDYGINKDATFEPKLALFAGPDGLTDYRLFWSQLRGAATKPAYVLTESLPSQHQQVVKLAGQAGYKPRESNDFVQCFALSS
jgi:release factor glutamine methyltransferase